jgi:2-polyprenyl-6-methoxyphenol hydroxylase-like FAD-dependent oxidoreductase
VKALIVGAGIGGLSVALALRRAGLAVEVYERTAALREAGAGLGLWPNAIHALRQLDLADALLARFPPIERTEARNHRGALLVATEARVYEERFGNPFIGVHRADLQALLVGALGAGAIHLGRAAVGFGQDDAGVTLRLADGGAVRGDLLVGADGVRSSVRQQLLPGAAPRYWGATSWRGVAGLGTDGFPAATTQVSLGPGAEFGILRLDPGRVYWYGTTRAPEGEPDPPGGARREVLRRFGDWHATVRRVVEATDDAAVFRTDIHDLEPLPVWGRGRVTLLGDAAHAMTPHLGQGACQAIEDAVVLGRCLDGAGEPAAGLRAYEAHRRPRTARLQARSRQMGTLLRGDRALSRWVRDALMRRLPASMQIGQLGWVLGYRA